VAPAIFGVSAIAAGTWFAGMDQTAHMRLAEEVFGERPIVDRFRTFLRQDRHHLIFNEQHVTVLTRLLLQHGRPGDASIDLTSDEIDALLIAMVAVGGLTARHSDPEIKAEDGSVMGWVPWLVRSGLYFDRSNLGNEQARARALYGELAGEADPEGHNWCDLGSWMRGDVAPVVDQFGFGYALAAFSKALDDSAPTTDRFIGIVPEGLLDGNLPADVVDRLIAAVSATRDDFQAAFTEIGDTVDHLLWDRAPFEMKPFLRLGDGRLVLLSPRFLHAWMGEGQYYRLLDSARRRPDPARPNQRASRRFTRFHGELVEQYLRRLSESSHEDQIAAGLVRISPDQVYVGRNGTERRSPDLMVDFTTDVVAIEITGGRPARRARVISDPALMLDELDNRVIGKMEELDAALADVLDGIVEIPDLNLELVERVWPVVIIPSTIVQSEVLWSHIREQSPNLFQSHRALQSPTLLSFEDYEAAMGAVEAGKGLPMLLAERSGGLYATMPPSHFFATRVCVDDGRRQVAVHKESAAVVELLEQLCGSARPPRDTLGGSPALAACLRADSYGRVPEQVDHIAPRPGAGDRSEEELDLAVGQDRVPRRAEELLELSEVLAHRGEADTGVQEGGHIARQ
jgi:hypothetical protein